MEIKLIFDDIAMIMDNSRNNDRTSIYLLNFKTHGFSINGEKFENFRIIDDHVMIDQKGGFPIPIMCSFHNTIRGDSLSNHQAQINDLYSKWSVGAAEKELLGERT